MGSLTFGNPAYLWGALAVSLPILVHLFSRRRPRPLPFGAIELVLRSQRQKRSNLRLRQLLLLILRCLLIAAIAFALARPSLEPKAGVASAPSGPRATALVLDGSLSMRYRIGNKALFEKARAEALAALDRLSPEEPATVGLCAGSHGFADGVLAAPSFDRASARRFLQAAQPGFVGSDMTACLDLAARALSESVLPGKRIFAFTDLSGHAFRLDAPPPLVPPSPAAGEKAQGVRPEVVLVDAAEGTELPNAAVLAVVASTAPRLGPRGYELAATIGNFGNAPLSNLEVELRIGAHPLAKGFVDIPAHETAKKVLGAVLPAGLAVGEISIAHADHQGLDDDDARPFAIQVPRDLKALIVDGAPSSLRERDEAWFVEAALNPARTGGRITASTLDQDAAEQREEKPGDDKPLTGVDVVLLLNPSPPKKIFAERLRAFVQKGGGLFIALGDHADPDALNESLAGLLPRKLHLIKTARDPLAPDDAPGLPPAARFGQIDWQHPIFRIFGPTEHEALESVHIDRYALLAADGPLPIRVLASYDDGAPALVEAPVGLGRVLLFTSSASASWNDWALHPSFLPAVQQAVSHLAGALEEQSSTPSQVGEPRTLIPPPLMRVAQVLGPDQKPLAVSQDRAPAAAPAGKEVGPETNPVDPSIKSQAAAAGPKGESVSVQVPLPGVYRVSTVARGATSGEPRDDPTLAFAAGLDAKESDLRRVDEAELKALLGGAGSAQVAASAKEAQGSRGTPLWPPLLLIAVLALLGEGALTRR
jgi:hypothetical protein